jgi:hypothetical protein
MSYDDHQLHKLRNGTIFLYTRNGSPIFHARVKIHGISGYVKIASTKKLIASEAYVVAKGWYEDAKQGRARRPRTNETWRAKESSAERPGVPILRHRRKS